METHKDLGNVIEFTEEFYGFELMGYQKEMINAILNGYTYSVPRRCGRTMVLNGYYEWLKIKYGSHIGVEDADINIKLIVQDRKSNIKFLDEMWVEFE